MNLRARVKTLERKQAICRGPVCPPVEFYDGVLAGTTTPQEWSRWGPWLLKNIFSSSKNGPPFAATESELTSPINDERER
jgi:hypothetical protein